MTDFQKEFNKIFSNDCSVENYDWNKKRFFDPVNNDCYKSETALMSSITSEAYNKFGFDVEYFIKDVNTKRDEILGEDVLENIVRRFRLKVYASDIPSLQKQYELQGMIFNEIITVQCTIQHFNEASRYDNNTEELKYDSYLPKIKDLMFFKYANLYYEILNVKTHEDGSVFLSTPITYTFHLRVWRNVHENVDYSSNNDDNMDYLRSYVELSETFDMNKSSKIDSNSDVLSVNKYVEKEDEKQALYNKDVKNKSIDPFDGW